MANSLALAIPTSVAAGAAKRVSGRYDKYVRIQGTFVATIRLQMSFDDGATWQNLDEFTAPGGQFVTEPCTHLRANVTAYTSGTPVGIVRHL